MMLSANVLKHIMGVIQRNPLTERDLEYVKLIPSSELADFIPTTFESVAIDLLISFGWKHYHLECSYFHPDLDIL